jgi:hypothetical protein
MNAKRKEAKAETVNDSKADLMSEAITVIEFFLYGGKADIEYDAMQFLRKTGRKIRGPTLNA